MEDVNDNIEEQVRGLHDQTSPQMDQRILGDLFERLEEHEMLPSVARPAGLWRTIMKSKRIKLAAAAVVAAVVMLPVGYGAVKAVMKHFVFPTDKVTFEYPEPNGVAAYGVGGAVGVMTSDDATEEEARARLEEFYQLYREGKAREVEPGHWQATLSNGDVFGFGGDPEHAMNGFTPEDKERMRQQFDEINELRKAGQGERIFLKEVEENGIRMRLYSVRYTLSNGEVISVGEGEEVK